MTRDLLDLADGLTQQRVTPVALESTGVFWQPSDNLLEGLELTVLVVSAQHSKAVPGRKTAVKEAEWIADLLRHGLLRGSYIPDRAQRELRELGRSRRRLIQQRGQVITRIQKLLAGANIKLSAVASGIVGGSGRAMREALAAGQDDPVRVAALARGRLQDKRPALEQALHGLMGPHQRMLLQSQLRHLDVLDTEIARRDEEVATRLRPCEEVIPRLDTSPGVGRRGAEEIVAEIGTDRSRFPSAAHLASWARVCPGNHESAGKRQSGRTGGGHPWLRRALVAAARGAAHTRQTDLAAQYRRIATRRGGKRAALALAQTSLVIIYHLVRDQTTDPDLGGNYFDERDRDAVLRRSLRRIEQLGFKVTVEAA